MADSSRFQLYLFYILLFRSTIIQPLTITACDCEKPVVKGIMDMSDPFYCSNSKSDSYKNVGKDLIYKILMKPKPNLAWEGYACSQWIERKTIEGNFWIGSYDTTYSHDTKLVEPAECWSMVTTLNCGPYKMSKNDNVFSFIQKPTGKGKWNSKVDHRNRHIYIPETSVG